MDASQYKDYVLFMLFIKYIATLAACVGGHLKRMGFSL